MKQETKIKIRKPKKEIKHLETAPRIKGLLNNIKEQLKEYNEQK